MNILNYVPNAAVQVLKKAQNRLPVRPVEVPVRSRRLQELRWVRLHRLVLVLTAMEQVRKLVILVRNARDTAKLKLKRKLKLKFRQVLTATQKLEYQAKAMPVQTEAEQVICLLYSM